MILAALFIGLGQLRTELLSEVVETRREQQRFTRAYETLTEDPTLAHADRGFESFIQARPELALAEHAYQDLLLLPSFRNRVGAFEEALRADEAGSLFQRYYAALARDAEARLAVEDLIRIELREGAADEDLAAGLAYLKGHPAEALEFLAHPARLVPTPQALWPLRNRFRRDEALREDLLEVFNTLDRTPAAHAAVYPWWAAGYDEGQETGEAYRALEEYLMRFPSRLWTWHRRNLAWAEEPAAWPWRDEGLADAYFTYVNVLRDEPAFAEDTGEALREAHGAAPPWPPAGNPPELPPWPPSDDEIAEPERPDRPKPDAPVEPRVPKPEIGSLRQPDRPDPPEAPTPRFGGTPK